MEMKFSHLSMLAFGYGLVPFHYLQSKQRTIFLVGLNIYVCNFYLIDYCKFLLFILQLFHIYFCNFSGPLRASGPNGTGQSRHL